MTARVAKPSAGQRGGFTVPYTCPCHQPRAVMARGIDPTLPLSDAWRTTGACPACGRDGRWRILDRGGHYLVEVETTDG